MDAPPAKDAPVVLRYPLEGWLRVRNSPAARVPSHGTHLMGTTFAIDLVPVDARGRSGPVGWRAVVATEEPERFVGFGARVVAPVAGTVVIAHDGEVDHAARRSPLALMKYMAGQARRIRSGATAIAGNHVVVELDREGRFALVAHLRRGSVCVRVGDRVRVGDVVGGCGNSGNSTQPHVHVQVTDSTDWPRARGVPITFQTDTGVALPTESQIVIVRDGKALGGDTPGPGSARDVGPAR